MGGRAWVIKLGSGGRCIDFCERNGVVGLGWKSVSPDVLASGSKDDLFRHVTTACPFYSTNRSRAAATGQLFKFARECAVGDYIVYYDPPKKRVVITRVSSNAVTRDFDVGDPADIWHVRRVETVRAIPVLDFYGGLKGRILGPRMSFWELRPFEDVDAVAQGSSPGLVGVPDPELQDAYARFRELVVRRAEALNEQDWEWLVVDYFKAQGAQVDERAVGGNRASIEAEARLDHGEPGDEIWRIQVKPYQDSQVDWPAIEEDLEHGGDSRFCFVSVYGFTDEARARANDEHVRPLEAGDFMPFLLSGRSRESLRRKSKLPALA